MTRQEAHEEVKNLFTNQRYENEVFEYGSKNGCWHFGKIELHDFIDKLYDSIEKKRDSNPS